MIDTHAHVNFSTFKDDADKVIQSALDKKIAIINVGSQISTSRRAVELAAKYPRVFAAIGLHPIHLQDEDVIEEGISFTTRKEEFNYTTYKELAKQKNVVAIGETGLDYYHIQERPNFKDIVEEQKKVFHQHIDLANEMKLPMIIHTRSGKNNSDASCIDILSELRKNKPKCGGVMHCYAGPPELIKDFVALDMYVSFNGILTFDKTGLIEKILFSTPEDRILTETDCPYLTPAPYRGKRNEPAYVDFVVSKIAELKNREFAEIDLLTTRNAERLFHIALQ